MVSMWVRAQVLLLCRLCLAATWESACETSSCSGDNCCPSNYYWIGERDCDDWFTGLFADNRIQTCQECNYCGSGQYLYACGIGSAGTCYNCGRGYAKSGTDQATQCQACDAGQYSGGGWTNCQNCNPGTFQPFLAMDTCYTCEDGQSSNSGSTSCFNCGTGSFALAGDSSCTTCPVGRFASNEKSSACERCAPGLYADQEGMSECKTCFRGTYSTGGASFCRPCDRGYFSTQSQRSDCDACPEGYFAFGLGSTECTACLAGTFSGGPGSSACSACSQGYYIPSSAQTTCLPCEPGTHGPIEAASSCIDCAPGTFARAAADSCTECPMGSFTELARQSECILCPAGSYGNESLGASSNETCSECPAGRASALPGAAGFDSCAICPAGRYAEMDASTECMECPPGRYGTLEGATSLNDCIKCPMGTFSNRSAADSLDSCEDCPPGTWSNILGETLCVDCEAGTYSNTSGATTNSTCEACDVGRYSPLPGAPSESSCFECPAGRWNNELAQAECEPCSPGTWSSAVGAVWRSTCQNCAAGSYSDLPGGSELASCLGCPPGKWVDLAGATRCKDCQEGTWSSVSGASEDVCQNCTAGRFGTMQGQSDVDDCQPCAMGTWSFEGLTACTSCIAGTWSDTPAADSPSTCTGCDLGRFSTSLGATSSNTCEACTVKTFANQSGSSECFNCGAGQASQEGSSECSDCGAGFYSGPASCEQCPVARYSDSPQASCSQCQAGYVVNTQRTACVPCAVGRYSDAAGAADCKDCGLGFYGLKEGGVSVADACQGCPVGRVSDVTFLASVDGCRSCEPGSFMGSTGAASCDPCPAGEYQETSGQAACVPCNTGRFLQDSGSSLAGACEACPAGRTSPAGASECSDCPAGRHAMNAGQGSCADCPAANETGSIGCCPGDSDEWPLEDGFMLSLPPGKSATVIHVLENCQVDVNPEAPGLEDLALRPGRRFSGNPLSLATIRPAGIHSCVDLACGANNTCAYVEPESADFSPGGRLEVYAVVSRRLPQGGLSTYTCPQMVSVSFAGFGCQEGALLSFGLAHLCVVFITLFLAILVELFLRRHIDVFLEVALDVSGNELQPIPSTMELHKDVVQTLQLKSNEMPPSRFQAWQTSQEDKVTKVQMEFQVSAIAGADMEVRDSWFAKANAHSLCGNQEDQYVHAEELYKQVESLEWKVEGAWSKSENLAVKRQPLAVVKEVGRLPGADLVDSLEAIAARVFGCCCGCISRRLPRLNEETEALRLRAARAMLQALMTRKMGYVLVLHALYTLGCVFVLPLVALQMMTCAGGYPYEVHFAWLATWLLGNFSCNFLAFCQARHFDRAAVQEFSLRFHMPLLLRFFFAFVSVTDLYQDATFPVISYRCGFDLWFVATWLVVLGVVVMQILLQVVLVLQCYRKSQAARTPEERERYHVEGLFLALRALDNHVLVYSVRPAVEERLGGSSCWKMKTVESRIAFSRFIFEDAEQCALQGIFLVWFESASLSDKIWIGLSTATSLSLSFTLAVQTFAEVRDWVWHRMLAVLTMNGTWISRWVMLMVMVVLYRCVSAFPWFGSCAPAEDEYASSGLTFILRFLAPWQFHVPPHVVQEIFSTSIAAIILAAIVTLLILLIYRRELGIVSVRRKHRGKYNFEERLKPPEQRLKSEHDEDDWLDALRELYGSHGAVDTKLASLDEKLYHLARGQSGSSKAHFHSTEAKIREELLQVGTQLPDPDTPSFKELERVTDSALKRWGCRTKALALLADRSFRKKSLLVKAQMIEEATGARLRVLPAKALSSLRELPRCSDEPSSVTYEVDELQRNTQGRHLILVYVSHTGEDNRSPGKVQGLLEFSKWFEARAREQEMDFELFFWIDYCCLSPTEAFAALPLFIATCTEILVWRTPLFDRRVWPLTERLLAYCFCKGGLTPYALDAASFVNTDETEAADAGEDEEKIEAIWAGSTGKAGPSPRKVAPAPQLQMLRRQRRLIDPLQETLLDTAGLQRRVAQLVDMASSVSALEIFADRQPVDFGLTAVVELWLGSNQTLPSKASKAPRVAWSGDATQWICASRLSDEDRALKASYEWRLKVEVKSSAAAAPGRAEPSTVEANNNPNADMDFYSDEWISVILPSDVDASSPSPNEIAEHFQQVDQILRSKKIGREVDLSQLETAAARLGSVLCADLARALEADTVEAIEGALKRNHRADLPKLHAALRRLCELQLLRALSGDESELTMALREAARVGGEEASYFEHFTEAKQKLSNLRAKRLQQQSLDVIRGDGKDLESVMAVISVALRRSDWDREWDQIWLEVLQEGRAQVKKMVDDAKSKGDHPKVAKIYRLAEKHGLRVIAAHTVAVWEDLIQSSRQDAKTLAKLCSAAYDEGAACKQFLADAEEAVLALAKELEEQWDKSKAQSCSESFAELVQELSADANLSRLFEEVQSAGYRASERERGLREKAEAVLQQKAGLMSHEDSELSMEHLQEVLEALKDSQDWQWQKNIHHATELLQKQVKACFKNRGMMDAQPMLLDLMEAAKTHQVTDQLTPLLEKALRGHLEKGGSRTKPQKETDAVKLLQISLCAEKLQLSDVRVKAIEEMKRSVEAMKNKGADGLTELRTFQDEAQRLDALAAVELATESLAQVEERERKKKEDFQAKLVAEEGKDIFGADPELTVQLVATAEQSGWQEQKNRAVELVQRRLLESARALKASSDEAISGVRFLARAFSEAEKAKCSVEASLKDALNQLEGSGDELVPLVRVIAWCQDLKWLLKSAQKKLNEWLKKWDAGPEHAPKDAEKAAEEAQKLDAKEIGEKIQAKLNADAIFKAATDAPADAEKALKAYEQSAKRSENLRKQALKMLTRTLEEAKQSGDEKQLTLLRDQKHQKTVSDQAGHLLSLMSQLPTRLAAGDWPGVCGLAASAQKEGYSALAKQARQHLRDRVDELTTKTESAEGPMLDLYKAAKKDGLDELAELLVQKLGSALPASWAAVKGTSLSVRKELISDEEVIKRMQEMVDHTFKTWGGTAKTRDRRKKLVTSIKVEEVIHVENPDNYLRYAMRREKVRQELQSKPMTGTELDDANPIKTKQVSLKGLSFHPDEPIDEKLQEVWLWHGTGKEGAAGITDTDFDMGRAGSAAGTMFGRGLYFAESCMKSDEYTKADERDWYPLILCRVTCGRLFYCDWKSPSDHKEKLEDACHHEGFHCVLGDREKVRGTYREFIVFDNDQVYPEYIVWYSR